MVTLSNYLGVPFSLKYFRWSQGDSGGGSVGAVSEVVERRKGREAASRFWEGWTADICAGVSPSIVEKEQRR